MLLITHDPMEAPADWSHRLLVLSPGRWASTIPHRISGQPPRAPDDADLLRSRRTAATAGEGRNEYSQRAWAYPPAAGLTVFAGLLLLWLAAQSGIPAFLLPTPGRGAQRCGTGAAISPRHTLATASEIVSGLALGVLLGAALALCMIFSPRLQRWLMPLVLTSRGDTGVRPAPLLVLWFGFGMSAKVAMAVLVIFFRWCRPFRRLRRSTTTISIWRARCALRAGAAAARAADGGAAGLRLRPCMAAAVAPIGAIIGEWVGSAEGWAT